jgi:hypothetical protein
MCFVFILVWQKKKKLFVIGIYFRNKERNIRKYKKTIIIIKNKQK